MGNREKEGVGNAGRQRRAGYRIGERERGRERQRERCRCCWKRKNKTKRKKENVDCVWVDCVNEPAQCAVHGVRCALCRVRCMKWLMRHAACGTSVTEQEQGQQGLTLVQRHTDTRSLYSIILIKTLHFLNTNPNS
jgi:hypothetical protein